MHVIDALDQLQGFATRAELMAMGCSPEMIDMGVYYGKFLRVRRGRYASWDTPRLVLRALRVGGRLACVSAVDHYRADEGAGPQPVERPVHVLVRYGSSRLGSDAVGPAVIHWTRRSVDGTRTVVSEMVALSQAQRCASGRSINGSG